MSIHVDFLRLYAELAERDGCPEESAQATAAADALDAAEKREAELRAEVKGLREELERAHRGDYRTW